MSGPLREKAALTLAELVFFAWPYPSLCHFWHLSTRPPRPCSCPRLLACGWFICIGHLPVWKANFTAQWERGRRTSEGVMPKVHGGVENKDGDTFNLGLTCLASWAPLAKVKSNLTSCKCCWGSRSKPGSFRVYRATNSTREWEERKERRARGLWLHL